jgi:hypothetical protein
MNLEIVDGKLHHCGKMARNIRKKQAELPASYNKAVHREICNKFKKSTVCRAALVDGNLVALGGGISQFLEDTCFVWFCGLENNIKIKIAIIKELIVNIRKILTTKNKVVSLFDLNDKMAIRMANFLGFEVSSNTDHNFGSYVMMEINKEKFWR